MEKRKEAITLLKVGCNARLYRTGLYFTEHNHVHIIVLNSSSAKKYTHAKTLIEQFSICFVFLNQTVCRSFNPFNKTEADLNNFSNQQISFI